MPSEYGHGVTSRIVPKDFNTTFTFLLSLILSDSSVKGSGTPLLVLESWKP